MNNVISKNPCPHCSLVERENVCSPTHDESMTRGRSEDACCDPISRNQKCADLPLASQEPSTLEKHVETLALAVAGVLGERNSELADDAELLELQNQYNAALESRVGELESQVLRCLQWMRVHAEREAAKVGQQYHAIKKVEA